MVNVTAATSFLGNEGMWRPGDTKRVSNDRAHELVMLGHVIEAADQSDPDEKPALQQVADALGATVATCPALPEMPGIPTSEKEDKKPRKTKEDKAQGLTKEAK